MAATAQPNRVQQQQQVVKGRDHPKFLRMSDDTTMMKQIQATHTPDGREVEVKPIVQVIEDILNHATPAIDGTLYGNPPHLEALEDRSSQDGLHGILEELAYTIQKLSCELSCKCSGGGDAHATTMAVFNMLSHYSWDAKVVLSLAAFAANYGEFWLVIQLYATNPLAKSVALLKQLPDIIEHGNSLKSRFDAVTKLIKVMLDVTKSIIEFKELPSLYISPDMPPMSSAMAHIPTAAYWTIRGIVACASQIISLIGTSNEYTSWTTESWELSTLAHKVSSIHEHLIQQLILCHQHIEEKKQFESYNNLVRIFEMPHLDNQKVLKTLIYAKEDIQPLLQGNTKVNIEILRRKTVLLLISDLDLLHEEIVILHKFYREQIKSDVEYEVVWLPVVDRSKPLTEENQNKFHELQKEMPWYTLLHPSLLEPAVVRYIKEVWHFTKKAILVVLDLQGKVVCRNALHMMWIWGNTAYPFTNSKEESLWKEETWRLKLLVDDIDATIFAWVNQGKYICMYGGVNSDWILNFNTAAREVAKAAGIQLEMVYVGKSNAKEQVRKTITFIDSRSLGYCWTDPTNIWFFWTRMESMLYSKTQHGKTIENDSIFAGVLTMLSFDGSDQGWSVICHGPTEMAKAKGDMILKCFTEYSDWSDNVQQNGFMPALNEHLQKLHTPEHCNRLILPGINGDIPEKVVCAECGRPMEKYFMYRCCTD